MKLRLHARHGVDHACEGGNVERVPHGGRRDPEGDRHVRGRGHLVQARDAVFGVDEEPLPVERDDLDRQRLHVGRHGLVGREPRERPVGVERVRADPGHGAQGDDDEQGYGPDDHFELGRVVKIRVIGRIRIRCTIAPREEERERDHRQDDEQHERGGRDDEIALLDRNVAGGVHDDHAAAGEQPRDGEQCQDPQGFMRRGPA